MREFVKDYGSFKKTFTPDEVEDLVSFDDLFFPSLRKLLYY
jgi:hypothetical protein